jgi:uncharacterized protein
MKWSQFNTIFELENKNIGIYNSLENSFLEIDKNTFDEIENDVHSDNQSDVINELLSLNLIVRKNETEIEIQKYKYKLLSSRFQNKFLDLTIAPTTYCNFDCTYCFEEFKPKVFLTKETEANILKFIDSFNIKNLHILWFGGEPLLNFRSICSITNKLIESKFNFFSSIITNGYLLTKEKVDKFSELRINSVQISLDGIGEMHDMRRKYKGGKSSFEKIIKNLDYLVNFQDINTSIQVTLDGQNRNAFLEILNFIKQRYPKNYKNNLFVGVNFVANRNSNPHATCGFDNDMKADYLIDFANAKVENDLISKYLFPRLCNDCMLRQINSFGIGPDGGIYKCLEHFGNTNKSIGNINKMEFDDKVFLKYTMDVDVLDDKECMECNILPVCGGGCPLSRFSNKENNKPLKDCNIFKDKLSLFLKKYYSLKQSN